MTAATLKDVCEQVSSELEELTESTLVQIRHQMPSYDRVDETEHRLAVRAQHERRILAISEDRSMSVADLATVAELARKRARQGVPLDEVIGAYHIGDQALWTQICRAARGADVELSPAATRIMESIQSISTALAAAHNEVTRLQQSHRITVSQRFVELLATGDHPLEASSIAEALGFRPALDFTAYAWSESATTESTLHRVQQHLSRQRGVLAAGYFREHAVLLSQGANSAALAEQISRLVPGNLGVGLTRPGLPGASLTIMDAVMAVRVKQPAGRITLFEKTWLVSTLLAHQEHLGAMYADALDVAESNPNLVDTIVAYAENGLSLASTGVALNVHPNTVKYRLDRWSELTGLPTRTVDGMALSLVAWHLSRAF